MKEKSSYNIIVKGIVQGVGFRPFIYKTAERYHLKGYVKNSSGQVVIRTEGGEQEISSFIKDIENTPPPAAMIKEITVEKHEYEGFQTFRIRESSSEPCGDTFISPDLAMCPECKKELLDSKDRRFHYPFINCTNCGPRFTIIENTPYDRARTTMKKFPMCPLCSEEYHNPLSRRFHAQPNACHICGPTIKFKTENYEISGEKAIQEGVTRLKKGEIGGIKGLGGFHLACDAKNSTAIVKLRKLKERSLKPFALMAPNIEEIQSLCYLSQEEKKLLQSDKAPIVILKKKADCTLPFEVAGDIPYLGFMLPYTPLHFLILQLFGSSLIMTSGNISDYPLIFKNDEAIRSLSHIADFFILHDRDILNPCDDSVIQVFNNVQYPLRLGRGYSPKPLPLKLKSPVDILALGGELKNTISLLHGENAFISQHIGDLQYNELFFEQTISHMCTLFRFNPQIIACDLHDEYISSKYASAQKKLPVIKIQHHHAHFASCLAENGFNGNAIGVIFDGQGMGNDGTLWGGEFFSGNITESKREIYFKPIPLPGGDKGAKEPWRMALSLMHEADSSFDTEKLPFDTSFVSEYEKMIVLHLIKKREYKTSSAGRLFDGLSAMLGIRMYNTYEGEAAILLEHFADKSVRKQYPFEFERQNGHIIINTAKMFLQIYNDIIKGKTKGEISGAFHETMAEIVKESSIMLRKNLGLRTVALSGGVFQNIHLLTLCYNKLRKEGFEILIHSKIPPNDACISLGQAVAALKKGASLCV